MNSHQNRAILAALSQNWQEALKENLAVLAVNPDDTEALNRSTHACIQIGDYKKAKSYSLKVLDLDCYNAIALKNLAKIKLHQSLRKKSRGGSIGSDRISISPGLFLEEPGRTKVVSLVNVAPKHILYTLSIGEKLSLLPKKHTLEVRSMQKAYLGAFPDDLGFRLRRLIAFGNEYEVYLKSVSKNMLTVFVKEIKRCRRFKNQPTFPASNDHAFYTYSHHPGLSGLDEDSPLSESDTMEEPEE